MKLGEASNSIVQTRDRNGAFTGLLLEHWQQKHEIDHYLEEHYPDLHEDARSSLADRILGIFDKQDRGKDMDSALKKQLDDAMKEALAASDSDQTTGPARRSRCDVQ